MNSTTQAQGLTPTQVRTGSTLLKSVKIVNFGQTAVKMWLKIWNRLNPAVTITGATNASPIVVTAVAHGFSNGDLVTIEGMVGATGGNGCWIVANKTADTFELAGSAAGGVWSSGGTAYAQHSHVVILQAGDTNRDAQKITIDYHTPRGGKLLDTGLSYAVSTSFARMTAPTGGTEPDVSIDYEADGV